MAIDPQVGAFLEELKRMESPPFHQLTPKQARAIAAANAKLGDPPEPVARIENHCVEGHGGVIPVRVYVPKGSEPLPVFVYYHGGGWVVGDVDTHEPLSTAIANAAGCIVVSVDYRLAPEHKFPAAVDDAYAAARWVAESAGLFGGDPKRLAVGGDSAGESGRGRRVDGPRSRSVPAHAAGAHLSGHGSQLPHALVPGERRRISAHPGRHAVVLGALAA